MRPSAATHVRNVEAVLESLRRGQRQLARNPRAAIEKAVKQLLSPVAALAAPEQAVEGGQRYRIDELARVTETTVRNIRAYQERGLLHAPTREGRTAFFDDTHVSRLKLITSMLGRGYTSEHIREMLNAWQHGKSIGDVLGLEQALVAPTVHDPPTSMGLSAARELAGGRSDLELLAEAGLVELKGNRVRVLRPQLLGTFAEMRDHGLSTEALVKIHLDIVPLIDLITERLVTAGVEQVGHFFVSDKEPTSSEVSELVDVLARFRSLATASVTATLDSAIERSAEVLLTDYLAWYVSTSAQDAG